MQLSIHYYVLSLSKKRSRLYEGFRDTLIDIQNTSFPFEAPSRHSERYQLLSRLERLQEFIQETDQHFAIYFAQDPLWMVLTGERKLLSIFKSTTEHHHALMGELEGDYSAVSSTDLGKIVWSVVKQVLAAENDRALEELKAAAESKVLVIGFDAVGRAVQSSDVSTIFVEDDYHVRGSLREIDDALVLSSHVDVGEVIDDAVDLIVDKVLAKGGNVVFLESNTMKKFKKIALIVRDDSPVREQAIRTSHFNSIPQQ